MKEILMNFEKLADLSVRKAFKESQLEQKILALLGQELKRYLKPFSEPYELRFMELKQMFSLSDEEIDLIRFLFCDGQESGFFFDDLNMERFSNLQVLSIALNLPVSRVEHLLRSKSALADSGLVNVRGLFQEHGEYLDADVQLFLSGFLEKDELMKEIMIRDFKPVFDLESFEVDAEEKSLILNLIESKPNAKILLYGVPGTGKTEFCRSLVKKAGMTPVLFNNDVPNTEYRPRRGKNQQLVLAASLLRPNEVLMVDEADSILNTRMFLNSSVDKGWLNQFLDRFSGRMVFIANSIDLCEASTLRRFDYYLSFESFSEKQRHEMWKNQFEDSALKPYFKEKALKELAEEYSLNASSIALAVKNTEALLVQKKITVKEVSKTLKAFLTRHDEMLSNRNKNKELKPVKDLYNPALVNSDTDLSQLEDSLLQFSKQKSPEAGVNLLFWGLPGTGKTEFAKYLSKKLKKELIYKRYSEISSKYVGETEKNIARAFQEAERKNAVLMLDEADSLFSDRENARQPWEKTQTNELLTRMENFKGVFIACTNLLNHLDAAALRRFHFKVQFMPALKEQRLPLVLQMLKLKKNFFSETFLRRIEVLDPLTPGDVFAVSSRLRFLKPSSLTPEQVVLELEKEIAYKEQHRPHARPLGFTA